MVGQPGRQRRRWAGSTILLAATLTVLGLLGFWALSAPPARSQAPPAGQSDEDKAKLERMKEKLKKLDPSMVIYLDSKGNIAGRGDPNGFVGEANRSGHAEHPLALELANLPKDQYGLVNWAEALSEGKISPKDSLDPNEKPKPPLDLDVLIHTKSKYQPDVIFPHKIHTMWLKCENCHDAIFKPKAGGNPEMRMVDIAAGQYCGRCHNRVAFPLTDCLRCHVKPKPGTEQLFQQSSSPAPAPEPPKP
jgi:c(7)-type cytochrome triheme protein